MIARRLLVTGLLLCAFAVLPYGIVRLTFGSRPVYVNVRWSADVDEAARQRLERRFGLADGERREGSTWGYALMDRSRANIRALVEDPAVADTHQIHRTAFRVGYFAERLPYRSPRPWIPVALEVLSLLALTLGCVAGGLAMAERFMPRVIRGPLVWLRAAFLNPIDAGSRLVAPVPRWIAGRIPIVTAEAVGGFRILFGTAVLLYLLRHDVTGWITAWLIVWGVLFIVGASARLSFVMLTAGVFAWAALYTIDISHHTVSTLLVTLVCLIGSRWGDAWSVDAWRRGERKTEPSEVYGFTVWMPSLVLGVAFAAAAFAKLFQGGIGWILNGTVKYHFLSDSREALVDWGLRAVQYDGIAVLLSLGAVAMEALVIVGVLARAYSFRLAAGVAALLLLSGFALFQGVIWPGWWILLLSFLPWHRIAAASPAPPALLAPRALPAYAAIVVIALVIGQVIVSALRLELSPMISAYDMYSTTYASPADFEEKASDAHWLVAIDDAGRRHQCRLTRVEVQSLTSDAAAGGPLPPALRERCLNPSLRVKTLTVEADRVRVDWARLRLEETGRLRLRSIAVND